MPRWRQCARGSQFGGRIEDASGQECQDQITATITVRAEDAIKANLAGGAKSGRDVAMRQTASDGERFTLRGDDGTSLEHAAQTFDVSLRPV